MQYTITCTHKVHICRRCTCTAYSVLHALEVVCVFKQKVQYMPTLLPSVLSTYGGFPAIGSVIGTSADSFD